MPAGRPTDYRPEFCEIVKELGKQGKSLAEIGSELGIVRSTLLSWERENPEFSEAMALARLYSQGWWESIGRNHVVEDKDGAKVNSSLYSRSMAARFPDDWREKTEQKIDQTLQLTPMSEAEAAIYEKYINKIKEQ